MRRRNPIGGLRFYQIRNLGEWPSGLTLFIILKNQFMKKRFFLYTFLLFPVLAFAQLPHPGKNAVMIRGRQQSITLMRAAGKTQGKPHKVLYLPGDGGWRAFAVTMAESTATWGYEVYGMDTKVYLESFTTDQSTLKPSDVMSDFQRLAAWITQGVKEPVTLVGWSEGAGLCLLGAAANSNKQIFNGLVAVGLSEASVLGWRLRDDITYLTKKEPNEPKFKSVDFLPQVTPLPLLMIQATKDAYVTAEKARAMFAAAQEPKQFKLINAQNHRFDDNHPEFFRTLREGLQWINKPLN